MRDFNRNIKFGKNKPSRRNPNRAGFGGPRSFRKPDFQRDMHRVICDKCGNECEVPFRPTGGKPVYCNDCFKKDGNYESKVRFRKERFAATGSDDELGKEIGEINRKLDLILEALAKHKK